MDEPPHNQSPVAAPAGLRWDKLDADHRASWETLLRGLTLPPLLVDAQALNLKDDEADPKYLARCIAGDPLLAAKVLIVANFAAAGSARAATTLDRAGLLLGQSTLQGMVRAYFCEDLQPESSPHMRAHLHHIRRLAALGAVLAGRIAQSAALPDPALISAAALLARLGMVVLAVADPDADKEYWQAKSEAARLQYEAQRWAVSSPALSGRLLELWGLPAPLPALAASGLDALWWAEPPATSNASAQAAICAAQALSAAHFQNPAARAADILERQVYAPLAASLRCLGLWDHTLSAYLHAATQREMELLRG